MKKIILGVISICFFSSLANATTQNDAFARINDLNLQTKQLQDEVANLRAEIFRIEHQKKKPLHSRCHHYVYPRPYFGPNPFAGPYPFGLRRVCRRDCENLGGTPTETGFAENTGYFNDFARMWGSPQNLLLLAAMGSTVTTSPFLGLRSAFDASDLIVNLPTMNEDLRFLKEHVKLQKKLDCYGLKLPDRPIIELGGKIEGIIFAQDDYNHGPRRSDINLSSARLDVLVEVSRGVHGFLAMNMDNSTFDLLNNSSLDIQLAGSGNRVFNSRVFVSRAFVTIGDLNCFPVYFTIGQMFVPFGRYASNMVTSTLTVELARTNERAVLLGLYTNGLYGSVYGFRGDSNIDSSGINQWGLNLGYEKSWSCGSINVGGGYIANIADSTGMQVTGAGSGFFGFGLNNLTENLDHPVPAYDVHGEFSYGHFNLFAEYIACTRSFDLEDLNFNGRGAKPTASNLELAYNFKFENLPASIAVGYGTSSEALALNIPEESYIAAFNISIWKNTIESLEFRHDNNYDDLDFAGGRGAVPIFVNSAGGSRNTYTLQVGIYF